MRVLPLIGTLLTAGFLFTACDSHDAVQGATPDGRRHTPVPAPTPVPRADLAYKVTVMNLTYAQPMAPMAVALHSHETSVFNVGSSASMGLEKQAEGGDNSILLEELSANSYVNATQGGNGLILPSQKDSVTIKGTASECLSVTSMLVNTNDAFTGINCVDVSALKKGEMLKIDLVTYDAGTESNSEEASSIPGPAGGGEGFNADRDDKDFVSVHPGVVTSDDGFISSSLTQAHKWDNPSAKLMIERVQ